MNKTILEDIGLSPAWNLTVRLRPGILLFRIVPFFPGSGEHQGAFREKFMVKKSMSPSLALHFGQMG
jgi:hypothetical protein